MIKITPLFSGSKGNCTLVQTDKTNLLLDIGYGYKQIISELAERGLTPKDIGCIIITHEHTDHIAALPLWTRSCATGVYAPKNIADYICQRTYCSDITEVSGNFTFEDINISTYECSHDARQCLGYRFSDGKDSVACVTDTGIADDKLIDFLLPCNTVFIESNHDVNMLRNGPYPYPLKQRILSPYGHLSNTQTAEVLNKIVDGHVQNIVLAHLSEQNNTKELAFATAVEALKTRGIVEGKDINVYVADQYKNRIAIC